jgi:hypothetical protein
VRGIAPSCFGLLNAIRRGIGKAKLVLCFMIGGRGATPAKLVMEDLANRLACRVRLTTDGHKAYLEAVEQAFGADIDYAVLVKVPLGTEKRYSPDEYVGAYKEVIRSCPAAEQVSTSYSERQNLNLRMGNRRFTRLTNAFSRKADNHYYSLAVYFMHYNFVRMAPAMAASVSERLWSMEEVVCMVDEWAEKQK